MRRAGRLLSSALFFLLLTLPSRAEPLSGAEKDVPDPQWIIRTARMEGASANIEEEARKLASTARSIVNSGRVHGLSLLVSDSLDLHRRVVSAGFAAEIFDEILEPTTE